MVHDFKHLGKHFQEGTIAELSIYPIFTEFSSYVLRFMDRLISKYGRKLLVARVINLYGYKDVPRTLDNLLPGFIVAFS